METWEKWIKWLLGCCDFLIGAGLIAVGIYNFIVFSSINPKSIFLNIYYIFFGGILLIFLIFKERVYACFNLLKYRLGKAFFFLFLATLTCDINYIFKFIICMICLLGIIINLVSFCLIRKPSTPETFSKAALPKKNPSLPPLGKKPSESQLPLDDSRQALKSIEKEVDSKRELNNAEIKIDSELVQGAVKIVSALQRRQ